MGELSKQMETIKYRTEGKAERDLNGVSRYKIESNLFEVTGQATGKGAIKRVGERRKGNEGARE